VCLEVVTRTKYETNTRFMRYVKNLRMSNYKTCQAFATSSESKDPYWFTPEIKADVWLLRAACQDPVFVTSMQRLMLDDLRPKETYDRVKAALRERGMLSGGASDAKHRRLNALLERLHELYI
jgi:hypothetical protein